MDDNQDLLNRIITVIINWIGSPASLVVHTLFIGGIFSLRLFGYSASDVLLMLTTILSIEAIYLVLFNQITLNRHTESIQRVDSNVEQIHEDIEEALEESGDDE